MNQIIISEKLKNSILERCCETSTGFLQVPSDIIKRFKNETGSTEPNWKVKHQIQNYINAQSN